MTESKRRYERIDIEIPCRLFIPEDTSDELKFEAFLNTRNLGLGGIFADSTFLLKSGVILFIELGLRSGPLVIEGRIVHAISAGDKVFPSGMGIEFLNMDSEGRETLMREFLPSRFESFFASMLEEFPHLEKELPLGDVSFILNLWEEWKIVENGGPLATESGAPMPSPLK